MNDKKLARNVFQTFAMFEKSVEDALSQGMEFRFELTPAMGGHNPIARGPTVSRPYHMDKETGE